MESLIETYAETIERFALQYGCTAEQAANVTANVYEVAEDQKMMVTIANDFLRKIKVGSQMDDLFSFQEDAALHSEMLKLDHETRVSFILYTFHHLQMCEIAEALGCTSNEVEERVQQAEHTLKVALNEQSDERLKKRLSFLGKSYGRLPLTFDVNQISHAESIEVTPKVKSRHKMSPRGWMTAVILGILVIGLAAATYVNGTSSGLTSDERYVEKMQKKFAQEKRNKGKILGVDEHIVNGIYFIENGNIEFESLIQELELRIKGEKEVNRKYADEKYKEISEEMKLPSELSAELFKRPLREDEEQSVAFASNYVEKLQQLQFALFEEVLPDFNKFTAEFIDDERDLIAERFLERQNEFSEQTKRAIKALESQSLPPLPTYLYNKESKKLINQFLQPIRKSLHPEAGAYFIAYEKEPLITSNENGEEQLMYSLEEVVGFIKEMENQNAFDRNDEHYMMQMHGTIAWLIQAVVTGKGEEPFTDVKGVITEPYQKAWKRLAAFGDDSGVGRLMTHIVEEMEDSGWKENKEYASQHGFLIYEAFTAASNRRLEVFNFNEVLSHHDMYENLMLDPQLMEENTSELYDAFSLHYNREMLVSVLPLEILSLFYYANDKEDPLTMWHLFDEASRTGTPEEYVNNWEKEKPLLKEANFVNFDASLVMGTEELPLTPIEFQYNDRTSYDVWMSYANDDVWQIQRIVVED